MTKLDEYEVDALWHLYSAAVIAVKEMVGAGRLQEAHLYDNAIRWAESTLGDNGVEDVEEGPVPAA